MSFFSKSSQYAIRAVFYIAKQSKLGHKSTIKEIAQQVNSPEHFLAKVLQKLSKEGFIESQKGPSGGFYLNASSFDKPILTIVRAIEGEDFLKGCGMGLSYCSEVNPCPLHDQFKAVRCDLVAMLTNTSIGQFNEQLIKGQFTLNK